MTTIIAIDGPAGAGKSTIAHRVADALDFQLIDTGAIYRTVAYEALEADEDLEDPEAVAAVAASLDLEFRRQDGDSVLYCNGEPVGPEIRTRRVSTAASVISAHTAVRRTLLDIQRELGHAQSCVLEGRDIGTVVFPDADVKVFLTASAETRAKRRLEQLEASGQEADYAEILDEIVARDERDETRAAAPLRKADDAVEVDTTDLDIDEVVERILAIVDERVDG